MAWPLLDSKFILGSFQTIRSNSFFSQLFFNVNLWHFVAVNFISVSGESYLASPGEFPFAVVVVTPKGDFSTGVLTTEEVVFSTCSLIRNLTGRIKTFYNADLKIIASNGDWTNDPNRQRRHSTYIIIHPRCTPVNLITLNDVAAIILDVPFSYNLFVIPASFRMPVDVYSNNEVKKYVTEALSHKGGHFLIAGFNCPSNNCSMNSPMLQSFTKPLAKFDCYGLLSERENVNYHKDEEDLLCFQTDRAGGPGSPIVYNGRVVAMGSTMLYLKSGSYLVATRFDVVLTLLNLLGGSSISRANLPPSLTVISITCVMLIIYYLTIRY